MWEDPFGIEQAKFLNSHTPGVERWRLFGSRTFPLGGLGTTQTISLSFNDTYTRGQFAYETVPFFHTSGDGTDLPQTGPRSSAYSQPAGQPPLPEYDTWDKTIAPGTYPNASQWSLENSRARLLTQKTNNNSTQVAMLGLNLIGSADPVTNARSGLSLASITVAFWGPDFKPRTWRTWMPRVKVSRRASCSSRTATSRVPS
jgi:hypothetical protein